MVGLRDGEAHNSFVVQLSGTCLDLGNGRTVEGYGMWRIGELSLEGSVAALHFEGGEVVEHF
jgi:hypothetical protein